MGYLGHPAAPVWFESFRLAEELTAIGEPLTPEIIQFPETLAPAYGMITTQTCDIVEEDRELPVWPWVQVVPVYDVDSALNSGDKRLLRGGRGRRRLLHVPAISPGFYVADFRISFPVEKGWLAEQECIDGFGAEDLRHRVGERLALLGGRPAFSGSFVRAVQDPLTKSLRDLKQADRPLFDAIDAAVPEVGIRLDDRLAPSTAQVVVLCDTPLTEAQREWWHDWLDSCRSDAATAGITLQALDFRELDSMAATEYRQMTIMPLVNVSPD